MKIRTILVLHLAFLSASTTGYAQVFTNGNFDSPVVKTNLLGLLPGVDTYTGTGITGWDITSGDVSIVDSGGTLTSALGLDTAPAGNTQYAVLNGLTLNINSILPIDSTLSLGSAGTLAQTFTTTVGQRYQVSFVSAGVDVSLLGGSASLDVAINSDSTTVIDNNVLSISANNFVTDTIDFTATTTSTTVKFFEPLNSLVKADGVALDNVTVVAIPEPSTYAMMGLGLLGFLAGRRFWGGGMRRNAISSSVAADVRAWTICR